VLQLSAGGQLLAAGALLANAMLGCAAKKPDDAAAASAPSSCPEEHLRTADIIARVAIADPLVLDHSRTSLPLIAAEDRATAERLRTIAQSETESVLLQLRCIQADSPPGAMWEVYVGMPAEGEPNATSPHLVGIVALYGVGVKSDPSGDPFAEFIFPLDRAILAASDAAPLQATFVASSGRVVDGAAVPPDVQSPVRIGEVNLLIERAATP